MSPASGFSQLTLCAVGAEPLTGAPAKRGEHATAPSKWPICRTRAPGLGWRSRLASLLTRPSPPLWPGIIVAAVLILGETVLVELLGRVGPRMIFGAVYLLGVLVISFGWGIGLSVVTTLVSAVAGSSMPPAARMVACPVTVAPSRMASGRSVSPTLTR